MESSLSSPREASVSEKGALAVGLFVAGLCLVDAFFIAAQGMGVPWRPVPFLGFPEANPMMALDHDGGHPELYGYAKEVFLIAGFAALFAARRSPILLGLAVTYALILLDDSLRLHENGGAWVAAALGLPPIAGLKGDDIGELLVWAGLGGAVAVALGLGALLSSPAERRAARPFLLAFAALVFFAVGVDGVHAAVASLSGRLDRLFRIIEDGGELMVLTVSCGLVAGRLAARRPPSALH